MKAYIYTDGSYKPDKHLIGCAILLYSQKSKRPLQIAYIKQLKSQRKFGSNIAELSAVKTAIKTALSKGFSEIDIYFDWTGIELFSYSKTIKNHHSICPSFSIYANYIERARKNIKINLIKVKAHSDNESNCYVDKMAKMGRTININLTSE